MAIDDESRHDLFVLLERDTSRETAAALMRHIPPAGWPDFATKNDVAVVGARMEALRHEMRADIEELGTRMIRWTVSTTLTAVGVAATVTGVIAATVG